jgi:hypothetical protein
MKRVLSCFLTLSLVVGLALPALAAEGALDQTGKPDLKSAGPLAFGPEGVLFVGDPDGATLYAVGIAAEKSPVAEFKIDGINAQLAKLLKADNVQIKDLAVQPGTGNAFLSVTAGGKPALVKATAKGDLSVVDLSNAKYAKMEIAFAPGPDAKDRRGNSLRSQSITDLAFVDDRVYISGVAEGETASTIRVVEFPFTTADTATGIEIYHGAHGKYETGAPVRTFTPFMFGGEPHLLAAYTCTPLVKLPISDLQGKKQVRGTTVAELGNRNQPLDIIAYKKDGKDYLLLANSARGVMKISTDDLGEQKGITERVADTAGLKYDTIASLTGVEQLAKLGDSHALMIVKSGDNQNLVSVALP